MYRILYIIMIFCLVNCGTSETKKQTSRSKEEIGNRHFFSVAWGCVELAKAELETSGYTIQDYDLVDGSCPASLPVLSEQSYPLLNCSITIGTVKIPASYILYDKRTLDGQKISDLRAEGFTESNFCPALANKVFK